MRVGLIVKSGRIAAEGIRPKSVLPTTRGVCAVDDRILIVDDNQDVADALVRLIKSLQCEATACYGGKDAADLAAVVLPDMAIIDLAMP